MTREIRRGVACRISHPQRDSPLYAIASRRKNSFALQQPNRSLFLADVRAKFAERSARSPSSVIRCCRVRRFVLLKFKQVYGSQNLTR